MTVNKTLCKRAREICQQQIGILEHDIKAWPAFGNPSVRDNVLSTYESLISILGKFLRGLPVNGEIELNDIIRLKKLFPKLEKQVCILNKIFVADGKSCPEEFIELREMIKEIIIDIKF